MGWEAKISCLSAIISSLVIFMALDGYATQAHSAAPAAVAAARHIQTMTYEVYAGGINAVTAELDIVYEAKDRYRLALAAWTKGFLGRLVPWSGTFETLGWRKDDGRIMPELHKSSAIWQGDEDLKEYHYAPDGTFKGLKAMEAGRDVSPENLDKALTDGTTDVLSATLQIMKAIAQGGQCEGSAEVFDGARRFEMVFKHEADEVLESTEYNVYAGPSQRCTVEVVPIAGKWHEKPRGWMSIQEQGREKGTMPTLWMAKIDQDGPAVPVKIRVKTDYGTLFMHLIHYKNGQKEIRADISDE